MEVKVDLSSIWIPSGAKQLVAGRVNFGAQCFADDVHAEESELIYGYTYLYTPH